METHLRTGLDYVAYGYDDNGHLETATGWEPNGASVRLHERFVYGYDAADNLETRTRNTLNQVFGIVPLRGTRSLGIR